MTIKKLCYLVMATAIIFVQEELLTVIPSVQLTFFLFTLYGAVFKIKYSLIIVVAHVLLDNLYMGSFYPYTIIPMLIGYSITVIFGYLFRKKSEVFLSIGITISTIAYVSLFLISTILVFNVDPLAYVIADIPFDLVMITCNVITILFLYKPMYNLLNRLINEDKYIDQFEKDHS